MSILIRFGAAFAVAAIALHPAAALAAPTTDEVLAKSGFSDADRQRVMAGEIVTVDVPTDSSREIALGLAFLIKKPPQALLADTKEDLLTKLDPNVRAMGEIHGDGSLADFQALKLDAGRIAAYRNASPGGDLNLSSAEIQTFQALAASGASDAAITDAVRNQLLARHRAYRAKGLAGIAPYARASGSTPAGDDLANFTRASHLLQYFAPALYQVLLGYPAALPPKLGERFEWTDIDAHGSRTLVLNHRLWLADDTMWASAQRQFYVSGSYNVEQAVAGFFPVPEGTLVGYSNRTSTDAVAGFGGSTKRALGTRVMESELRGLFEKIRTATEK